MFSQQHCRRFESSWMWRCVTKWGAPNIWKVHDAFIFKSQGVPKTLEDEGIMTLLNMYPLTQEHNVTSEKSWILT